MTAAEFGAIVDDDSCWPAKGDLLLNRCRYGAFTGGPIDARRRLDWLDRQTPARWGAEFWPQPYEQLARVLRELGHAEDARAILVKKDELQREARRERAAASARAALRARDWVLWATVRYGRQPLWAFAWLFAMWLYGVAVFTDAERAGVLKPNAPVFLRSAEWADCESARNQVACFLAQPLARSYPEFNVWAYSADTLLPIVDLEMQQYWIPDDRKGWGG